MKNKLLSLIRSLEYKKENGKELTKEKRIFLACVQNHGNLGDQALTIAAKNILSESLPNYAQVELTVSNLLDESFLKKLQFKPSDIIVIQGGGFFGNLWSDIYTALINIITIGKNNTIIVFPQSFSFTKDKEGTKEILKCQKLFKSCKDFHILVRDYLSYEMFNQNFHEINTYLCPDIVFCLNDNDNQKRDGVLFLMRQDKEKKISKEEFNSLLEQLTSKYENIHFADTVIKKRITKRNREKEVSKKLEEIKKHELVITDRLHGMIFSYITKTPCLVLSNNNHKVKGAYDWIKEASYIKYLEDININFNEINKLGRNKKDVSLKEKYDILIKVLEKIKND